MRAASTKRKNVLGMRTPCPRFTEKDQSSIFDFPPIWRSYKGAPVPPAAAATTAIATTASAPADAAGERAASSPAFREPAADSGEWVPRNFDARPYNGVLTSVKGSKLAHSRRVLTVYTLAVVVMAMKELSRLVRERQGSSIMRRKRDAFKVTRPSPFASLPTHSVSVRPSPI